EILSFADRLGGMIGMMKLGLQAFIANGPRIVRDLRDREIDVFLDLKLHDIPNTVFRAVQESVQLDVSLLTIHAAGGVEMMQAAVEGAKGSGTRILGVTVLTSHDEASLKETGMVEDVETAILGLSALAARSGVDGVVASPREIGAIRSQHEEGFLIVTPGIRTSNDAKGDQRRTTSASTALREGADYLVIGRPITDAPDPVEAVMRILEESRK
ncbi:MAG: orotidine-5'-phosphate decarboxylase, partial [Thermoanaerobaculia bacterium]|nr:orotidine-5'-phosphate decarboxylase [Thermoanaerobaculia bacterium]